MKEACKDCKFWEVYPFPFGSGISEVEYHVVGDCHRFPPQVIRGMTQKWQETQALDWCGEFKAKEEKVNVETLD
jgi:hypothetical protein